MDGFWGHEEKKEELPGISQERHQSDAAAWQRFFETGEIKDYLAFKNIREEDSSGVDRML